MFIHILYYIGDTSQLVDNMTKKDFIEATKDLPDNAEIEVFIRASQILRRKPLKIRVGHQPMKKPFIVIEVNKAAK